jgi:glycerol-3-phosphate dehydrogenase
MVSVTGGKLTTYRKMAADAVDVVVRQIGRGSRRSPTKRLPIRGALGLDAARGPASATKLGVDQATLDHLIGRHGDETPRVVALIAADPVLSEPLVPGLPYLKSEAIWAVREEMATTLDDVLSRRTRAQLLDRDATAAAAEDVASLIGPELGWDEVETANQVKAFRAVLDAERDVVNATR